MKDYEFVSLMGEGYSNKFSKTLEAVGSAINNKHYDILNFPAVKKLVEEVLVALEVKMRFDSLVQKASGKLICNSSGFELDGHKFTTLDEIEKALDHKAFL